MTFNRKSKDTYVLFTGFLAATFVELDIIDFLPFDNRNIILNFIKSQTDFEEARKYVGGYECHHTNEFGLNKIYKLYNFGPFKIDLLDIEDIEENKIENLNSVYFKMVQNIDEIHKEKAEFIEFEKNVLVRLEKLTRKNSVFYQINAQKNKIDELSIFTQEYFTCCFIIDTDNRKLTIFQIDDD